MFSIESLPDDVVDAAVRADWQRLIDADLPSAGRHPSETNRPHVTLAVHDDLPEAAMRELARVGSVLPVEVRLGGAVVFAAGERFVLARPVVMTAALLRLHADIVDLVGPPPARYAVTAKDRWTPHMTLARRMTAEQVGRALGIVGASTIEGELTGLRLWDAEAKVVTPLR